MKNNAELLNLFDTSKYKFKIYILSFGYKNVITNLENLLDYARRSISLEKEYEITDYIQKEMPEIEEIMEAYYDPDEIKTWTHVIDEINNRERMNKQLMNAAKNGDLEKIKKLIKAGADIHTMNDKALRAAEKENHLEVVKYLANIYRDYFGTLRETKRKR